MATINLKSEDVCGGGGHMSIRVTINGVDRGAVALYLPDLTDLPIADEDKELIVSALLKLAKTDHTATQIRNGLTNVNGYTITL